MVMTTDRAIDIGKRFQLGEYIQHPLVKAAFFQLIREVKALREAGR